MHGPGREIGEVDPKAVVISRDAFSNFVSWVDSYFSTITQHDRVLLTAEFTFEKQ